MADATILQVSFAEIMKDDGTMARGPDLIEFCAREHHMKMLATDSQN